MLVTSPPVAKSVPDRSCALEPAAVSDGDVMCQKSGSWRNVNAMKYVCVAAATNDVAVYGAENTTFA